VIMVTIRGKDWDVIANHTDVWRKCGVKTTEMFWFGPFIILQRRVSGKKDKSEILNGDKDSTSDTRKRGSVLESNKH